MADKRLDQTTNASAVAAADNIPFVTAAGVTSYVTGDEMAASGPFSSRYASSTAFPSGAFTAWTPTVTSQTGTITTVGTRTGRYTQLGKLVVCHFKVIITTKGTAGGLVYLTLPVNARSATAATDFLQAAVGNYREIANTGLLGAVLYNSATQVALKKADNGSAFGADGDYFVGTFMYEAE